MKKLKVAIIGVGGISGVHIDGYLSDPRCELYAFCDINEKTLKAKGEKYGITRLYTDYNQMFKACPEIDVVNVCTWNNAHVPAGLAAVENGCHVFCEKPMAMSAEESEKLKLAAEKKNVKLALGFVRRFGKDAVLARELVENGMLGDIYYAKAEYLRRNGNPRGWFSDKKLSGGGPMIDLGVHVIDLVRYIAGNPLPVAVYGATFVKLGDRHQLHDKPNYLLSDEADERGSGVCDVEDLATATIRFDNGMILNVETSYSLNIGEESRRVQVLGDKGGITINPDLVYHGEVLNRLADITFATPTRFAGTEYSDEIHAFISAVEGKEQIKATAADGVWLMKILDAIYESARTQSEVKIK